MDAIDIYCERLDASFWAEPINAITNLAFIVASILAFILYRRAGLKSLAIVGLIALIFLIGIGSFLFHTFANSWSEMADVLPITLFQISFLVIYPRLVLQADWWKIAVLLVVFFALSYLSGLQPSLLNGSIMYLPAIAILALLGVFHYRIKAGSVAMFVPSGLFLISLAFRSLDMQFCQSLPIGTHFVWHCLNATLLFLLVKVLIDDQAQKSPESN